MKAPVINLSGTKVSDFELPNELFGVEVSDTLISQYIRVYLSRQRKANAKTLTRSEITGTTAKVWRQKGTGRARHGSRKAPIFVGGGKAHGPTGEQNYSLRMSKTQKRMALLGVLNKKIDQVVILDSLEGVDGKSSHFKTLLSSDLLLNKKTTLVLDLPNQAVVRAGSNLNHLSVTQAKRINAYEVISTDKIVFTKESLKVLSELWSQE